MVNKRSLWSSRWL